MSELKTKMPFSGVFGKLCEELANGEPLLNNFLTGIDNDVKIDENENEYTINLKVAGISPSNINISIKDSNKLIVQGKYENKKSSKDGQGVFYENMSACSFHRIFDLPSYVDAKTATSELLNDTLTIKFKKKPEQEDKPVSIKVNWS